MPEELHYNKQPVSEKTFIALKELDLDAGFLGKFFGGPLASPSNIAGAVCLLLVLSGICFTVYQGLDRCADYWKVISPLITLSLGYIFGKKK